MEADDSNTLKKAKKLVETDRTVMMRAPMWSVLALVTALALYAHECILEQVFRGALSPLKATRAFMTFVRAYKEHQLNYIFAFGRVGEGVLLSAGKHTRVHPERCAVMFHGHK